MAAANSSARVQRHSLADRFWAKVQKAGADDCWRWTASTYRCGYGRINVQRDGTWKIDAAHRVAWELTFGAIPAGLCVCHACDHRPDSAGRLCVNPSHMFLGTKAENSRDMVHKQRQSVGEHHGRSKLTDDAAREILAKSAAGLSRATLAADYGVSSSTISRIARRTHWRHL